MCVFDLESGQLLVIRIFLISFSGRYLRLLYTKVKLSPALLPEIPLLSLAKINVTYGVTIKEQRKRTTSVSRHRYIWRCSVWMGGAFRAL